MDFFHLFLLYVQVLLNLVSRDVSPSSDPSSQISHINITCDLSYHGECSLPIAYHDHLEEQSSMYIHINVAQLHLIRVRYCGSNFASAYVLLRYHSYVQQRRESNKHNSRKQHWHWSHAVQAPKRFGTSKVIAV